MAYTTACSCQLQLPACCVAALFLVSRYVFRFAFTGHMPCMSLVVKTATAALKRSRLQRYSYSQVQRVTSSSSS